VSARGSASRFDAGALAAEVRARGLALGTPVHLVDETPSTMDDAARLAREGAPDGTLVVAETQHAGRGRHGRVWLAPPGENLTFSLVLRRPVTLSEAPRLTLIVGLAVRAAVAAHTPTMAADGSPQRPLVKWPNDVLVNGRKLAGILVETQVRGAELAALIVGVGINVATREFPPPIATTACSLAGLGGRVSRESLLADVLAELEARLARFAGQGFEALREELTQVDALAGKRLTVGNYTGIARGFDESGALVLVTDDGGRVAVFSGEAIAL
jgi:BirA family biotin operon repressor/biotin-[acetyl-CoA-carboxylase] ligase